MSDRLQELLRQRQLIQEHLAWLDQQIARERGESAPSATPLPSTVVHRPSAPVPTAPAAAHAATPAPDEIIAQYHRDPKDLTQDVRKGCFAAFFLGMAILLGTVGIAYFLYVRRLAASEAAQPVRVEAPPRH